MMRLRRRTPGHFTSFGGDGMLHFQEQAIDQLQLGEMGIKSAALGETQIYVRPGGYIFLELSTEKERETDGKLL